MKRLPFYDDAKEGKRDSVKVYLRSLREQWFMLFDRMAEFQLVGGPWMLDKNNKPNIAYTCTIDLLVWPRGKKRIILKETRDRAALVLQRAQQANQTIQPFVMVGSVVDLTTPTKISQIHNTMAVEDDLNKVTVKYLESFNTNRLRVPKRPQKDNEEIFKRLRLDTEDDEISNLSTEKQKRRAWDVLQRQVEEDERLKALEAEYESSLRQKICTQSLKTIKKYHDKYRVVTQENESLMKRDSDYEKELQQFISESFKNWGWDSDDAHSILLSLWAERLKDPNNTEKDQEWIRVLIKALKDERASFKSRLTREFMFTRCL